MKSPLIPDSENPKWIIAKIILEAIGSGRAKKTASRLKIPDVERFIDIMRITMVADLFERSYSDFISELKDKTLISPSATVLSVFFISSLDRFLAFILALR